jgi:hypothetical protein
MNRGPSARQAACGPGREDFQPLAAGYCKWLTIGAVIIIFGKFKPTLKKG